MFKKLAKFAYKRNWKEAIGFYLAYFLVGLILAGIFGSLFGVLSNTQPDGATFTEGRSVAFRTGQVFSIIYSLVISFVVLVQRKLYENFGWVILALLNGVLTIFGGLLLGLVIPALMTTRGTVNTET